MVLYVAVIAVLNLGLGYAVGLYMERGERLAAYGADPLVDD
jgi:hypothetical protein